jgi:hypothetical protein
LEHDEDKMTEAGRVWQKRDTCFYGVDDGRVGRQRRRQQGPSLSVLGACPTPTPLILMTPVKASWVHGVIGQ